MKIHDEKAKRRHAWCEKRLKYMASCNDDVLGEKTDEDYELEYIDIGNVSSMGQITTFESMPFGNAPSRARRKVKEGDVIVSTVRTYLRAIAKIENPTENTVVSTGFAVVRPRQNVVDGGFLGFALRSSGFIDEVVARSTGVSYPAITANELMKIPLQFPPLSEQRAIADFLDRETGKIDRLIAEKEKLLVLLEEKRKATISQAVTKGLNPDVAMKDSGIPWLGMIPVHWEVKRLKFLGCFLGGGTPTTSIKEYWNGNIPWVSPKDMKNRVITDTVDHLTQEGLHSSATQLVNCGSLLIVMRSGILRHTIPVAIAGCKLTLNQDMKAFVGNGECLEDYLYLLITSKQNELLTLWRKQGATVESLEFPYVANSVMPIPPKEEQKDIIQKGIVVCSRIEKLISEIIHAISLLRERRAALISAAVTGQIDVRRAGATGSSQKR